MQAAALGRTKEEIVAAIEQLDLGPITFKLMDPEEGQGWTREYAAQMELTYRRYLILLAKYPDRTIAPTKDLDKYWHGHILDTMKYAEDCERTFGYFLHHFPYFGMRGETDAQNLASASSEMADLYAAEFGVPLAPSLAFRAKIKDAGADAAWCIKADAKANDAAWCIKAEHTVADAAWCIKAEAKAVDAAWCIRATDTAWCIKAESNARDAAWCIKAESTAADAAWCIKAEDKAADAAWCIKVDAKATAAAWCIKADAKATDAAWCIKAENPKRTKPDVTTRPRLSS